MSQISRVGRLVPLLVALITVLPPAAGAQPGFTRIGLADTLFADRRADDFWINTATPGDVDGDGDTDLVIYGAYYVYDLVRPWYGILSAERVFRVFTNDGAVGDTAWAFAPGPEIPLGEAAGGRVAAALGDYDNDGDLDLAFAPESDTPDCCWGGGLRLFRNDGGQFAEAAVPNVRMWDYGSSQLDVRTMSWADTDNDGDLDLLLPGNYRAEPPNSGFRPAIVLRNDGPEGAGGWAWTETQPGLPVAMGAASAWADQDADGDLDLLLGATVADSTGATVFRTWRNDGGQFTAAGPSLPPAPGGAADWTDFDGDGDLDVLLSGRVGTDPYGPKAARLYVNEGSHYTETVLLQTGPVGTERWFDVFASSWADYDSDGDQDILAAGSGVMDGPEGWPIGEFGRAIIFRNDGAGGFTPADTLVSMEGDTGGQNAGAFAWFDIDGDGDLDHFAAGSVYSERYQTPIGNLKAVALLYRNDAVAGNAPPTAPGALVATATADGAVLAWGPAADDHTPAASLTYNLRVSTHDGQDVVSPHARTGGGRLVPEPGNVSHDRAWPLRDLPPGEYTWAVQAVDNAFNGGPFADGGSFTVGTVDTPEAPGALAVLAVAPNPSAGAAEVALVLPSAARADVTVYDALGRQVAVLAAGSDLATGRHAWPVSGLAPGVYTARAVVGGAPALVVRLTVVR